MLEGTFKSYTGILFDEIKIKQDLVYDKHTGELIGYCNLDAVGNELLELEKATTNSSSELAKCMLVIMVRGVATSLKFPLAGFATNSITADFLYPIIWKAVSILHWKLQCALIFCYLLHVMVLRQIENFSIYISFLGMKKHSTRLQTPTMAQGISSSYPMYHTS